MTDRTPLSREEAEAVLAAYRGRPHEIARAAQQLIDAGELSAPAWWPKAETSPRA